MYNMSAELVTEACNRTLIQLSKPDFKYTDGILGNWSKNGLTSLESVKANDRLHYMSKSNVSVVNRAASKPANNRFNNFEQRKYDDAEMAGITKKLLKKV